MLWRYWKDLGWWTASPWLPRWNLTLRSYVVVLLDLNWEMPLSIVNSYEHRCSWWTPVWTYVLQLTHWANIWLRLITYTRLVPRIFWDIFEAHSLMDWDTLPEMWGYMVILDADCAGSVMDCKNTSVCCFSLGCTLISWMSRKQKSVALSTAEAEYIVASMASCEVV